MPAMGPRCRLIASHKASLFWFVGLSFAGSTVVFAVGMSRRMMGLRRMNLPMCEAHSSDRLGSHGATALGACMTTSVSSSRHRAGAEEGFRRCALTESYLLPPIAADDLNTF